MVTGCGSGLLFSVDKRLRITSPRSLSTVSTPVQLRWTGRLPTRTTDSYAVFVDALPVHPGQNLRSLADQACARAPGCVDVAWLNRHFVYLTRADQLELDNLPILGTPKADPDMHSATIVVVNSDWTRVGESAWTVSFALASAPPL
jgi:hypothetical protein